MNIHYLKGFKAFYDFRERLKSQNKNEFGQYILQAGKQEAV